MILTVMNVILASTSQSQMILKNQLALKNAQMDHPLPKTKMNVWLAMLKTARLVTQIAHVQLVGQGSLFKMANALRTAQVAHTWIPNSHSHHAVSAQSVVMTVTKPTLAILAELPSLRLPVKNQQSLILSSNLLLVLNSHALVKHSAQLETLTRILKL